jgi:cysteine synthase A
MRADSERDVQARSRISSDKSDIADKTILDAIGDTPLLQLEEGIIAKCEFLNPSGSIKARMAKHMIEKAEAEGQIKPGETIVESTSGNSGNALSMVAAVKGYNMLVVMPEGYTSERVQISRGYGAEMMFVGHFQVNEALDKAKELGEQEGYFCPQQFDSDWNVEENRQWLGPEIVEQLPADVTVDALVQGVGTGGTLIGVTQALRDHHNPEMKAFAMEPSESQTLRHGQVADHRIEGISDGFVPGIYQRHGHIVDDIINVDSDTAVEWARAMAKSHGLFVGPSAGANYWAAREIRRRNPEIGTVLTFLCDKCEKYLSMMYN